MSGGPEDPRRYGVDAELERLLRCPACGSSSIRPAGRSYGLLGLRVLGEYGAPRDVICRRCQHTWLRPPMRDLRREAQRRIDDRYAHFDDENLRLRRELEQLQDLRRGGDPAADPGFAPDPNSLPDPGSGAEPVLRRPSEEADSPAPD